ncbi:hypothetical protein [Serratia liquefaciens]|uniref:hypothetical protein n=1 Tax=Serratia liquefaciens TaxID=614 RepID=UPI003B437670
MKYAFAIVCVTIFSVSGCAMKKVRFVNYHNKCEALNPEPQDFISYVDCMNNTINGDLVTKETVGATKYLTLANRYKNRVISGEMKKEDAKIKLNGVYTDLVNPVSGSAGPSNTQNINVNAVVTHL